MHLFPIFKLYLVCPLKEPANISTLALEGTQEVKQKRTCPRARINKTKRVEGTNACYPSRRPPIHTGVVVGIVIEQDKVWITICFLLIILMSESVLDIHHPSHFPASYPKNQQPIAKLRAHAKPGKEPLLHHELSRLFVKTECIPLREDRKNYRRK